MTESPLSEAERVLFAAHKMLADGAHSDVRAGLMAALEQGVFSQEPSLETFRALRLLGQATRKHGDLPEAVRVYTMARRMAHSLGRPDLESGAVEGLAIVARIDGESALSLRLFDESAELAQKAGDAVGHAAVLSNKGNFLADSERFKDAERVLREAGSHPKLPLMLRAAIEDNLSVALAGQERWKEAIAAGRRAAEMFAESGAGYDRYETLRHLEQHQRAAGDTEAASATFAEAHQLIAQLETDNLNEERYLAFPERAQTIEKETFEHLAAQRHDEMGDEVNELEVRLEIGILAERADELGRDADRHFENGDFEEAEAEMLEALRHWQHLRAIHMMPRVQHALGAIYTETGQLTKAKAYLLAARTLAHQLGDAYREMTACANLCRLVLDAPGELAELDPMQLVARALALRPLAFAKEGEPRYEKGTEPAIDGGVLETLDASICLSHEALDLAEAAIRRAIETIEPIFEEGNEDAELLRYRLRLRLLKLYTILKRRDGPGDADDAASIAQQLDEMLGEATDLRALLSIQATLGAERFNDGLRDEETLARLLAACDAYEEIRKRALPLGELGELGEIMGAPFPEGIEVAIELGRTAEAVHLLERSKSRSLLDAIGANGLADQAQLAQPATATELTEALTARSGDPILIELFVGPRQAYAFVLDGQGRLEVRPLADSRPEEWRELSALVRRNALRGEDGALDALRHPVLRELSRFVREVGDGRPTYLCPHSILHALPLHLDEEDGELVPLSGVYHLPSGSLLRIDASEDDASEALVGGDPLDDLPFAALEAGAVAGRYGVEATTGSACDPEWLQGLLEDGHVPFRLVHLACHAVFHPSKGERSGLLLGGEGGASLFSIRELAALDWSGDLVFLSACSSGQQEVRAGDELAGISRTLLGRGARALVAALWKVPDLATFLLVEDFYSRLEKEGKPGLEGVGVALAGAQRAIRDLTARQLIEVALRLRANPTSDDDATFRALKAAGAAHSAAENNDQVLRSLESLKALTGQAQPAPDIGELQWEDQTHIASGPAYEARPFADPANWAAFVLVARR
ncbi:MAG TPA: CHAT domain-containing protein [Solirubrobacterales bacterium]|nr:CHAT domain-containing protein [Solirubrobacterales bacterium]